MCKSEIKNILAISLIGLAICGAAHAEELTIGALLPLTGPAAPIGIEQQNGVQFAIDQYNESGGLNGTPVKVAFDDSQGKPDQGVLAFNRMTDLENVPAMLTAFSSISLAIAPLGERREVLIINPAAQSDSLANASKYLINTIPLVGDEAHVLADYASENIGKSAAIIYENGSAGVSGRDSFKQFFEAAGGAVIADEPVEFGQTNYRATLLKIAAAKPDFVYIAITQSQVAMADQVGQIPGFPLGIGNTFSSPFFGHPSTEGWYQTGIQSGFPKDDLVAKFNERFGTEEMGFFAREYYNATNMIIRIAQHLLDNGSELTGKAMRDAVFEIGTFNSDIANLSITTNTASRPVEILQYQGDERVVIATGNVAN
ncbi:MAG: ABC transporter substrate-binding protein [Rhizobiaceae bacterium]|nr:ABC transporter substrate-binding protein [Rhizobiaceae bacterium]